MPLVKLWNNNRTIRKLVVADDLQNLIRIGRDKFGFHSGEKLRVVTESDGNELESEEVFSALVAEKLFPHTVLQLMQETESWTPQQEISNLEPENSYPQTAFFSSSPSTSTQSFSSSQSDSEKFIVPWSLFPKTLLDDCNANKVPRPVQVRQLVRITVDELMNFTPKPKRSDLNTIAKQIVEKYPKLGLEQGNDYDHERLFDQLENRVRNVQRPTSKLSLHKRLPGPDEAEGNSKKVKRYSHGCAEWQPDAYIDGETETSQVEKKEWLLEQNKRLIAENVEIRTAMQKTYALQRLTINQALPIPDVLNQWPYLFKRDLFLQHANVLLGKNITQVWKEELEKKLQKLVNFFRSCPKMTEVMQRLETAIVHNNSKVPEEAGILTMLMTYFEEEESSAIQYFEVRIIKYLMVHHFKAENQEMCLNLNIKLKYERNLCVRLHFLHISI